MTCGTLFEVLGACPDGSEGCICADRDAEGNVTFSAFDSEGLKSVRVTIKPKLVRFIASQLTDLDSTAL